MQYIYDAIGYVFDPIPPRSFSYYIVLAIITALIIAFSVYIRVYIKKNREDKTFRKLFRGYPPKLETIAAIMAVCLLARYYGVAFISTRVLLFGTLFALGYLVYKIIKVYLKTYPEQKKAHLDLMKKNKYLPRKKRR